MKMTTRSILLLLLIAFAAMQLAAQGTLRPSETHALLHVVVTDFSNKPLPGEKIFFSGANPGSRIEAKTNAAGKLDVLLPKGDTYAIKYQGFLDEKESSTIEVPSGKGLAEATLTVQLERGAEETIALDIHFETGKAEIKPESHGVLDEIVAAMRRNPTAKIELAGHTDSDGDAAANLTLSQERAAAARNYLVGKGIAAGRITTTGFGETKPVASNGTPQGKAQNRRTELRVLAD